jgi:hypothetical protein
MDEKAHFRLGLVTDTAQISHYRVGGWGGGFPVPGRAPVNL